jgi:shikimate kinase
MEDLLFNEDISINFSKFENENCTLLIGGLPKSGKTALSRKISKKYNASVYHTDNFDESYTRKEEIQNMTEKEFLNYDYHFYKKLSNIIHQKEKKCIVEGVYIVNFLLRNFIDINAFPNIFLYKVKCHLPSYLKNEMFRLTLENSIKDYNDLYEKYLYNINNYKHIKL